MVFRAIFLLLFLSSPVFSQSGYFANNKKLYHLNFETGEVNYLYETDYFIYSITINSKNEIYATAVINYQGFLVSIDVHNQSLTVLKAFPPSYSFYSLAFDKHDNLYLSFEDDLNRNSASISQYDFQANNFVPSIYTDKNIKGHIAFDPTDNSLFFWKHCCISEYSDNRGLFRVSEAGVIDTITTVYDEQAISFDPQGNLYSYNYFLKFNAIDKVSGESHEILPEKLQEPVSSFVGFDFEKLPIDSPNLILSPAVYDFGFVDHDHPTEVFLRVKNVGRQTATIDSISFPAFPFKFSGADLNFPVNLELNETLNIPVSFSSKETQYYEDNVQVYWNNGQTLTFQIKGFSREFSKAKNGVVYSLIKPHSILTLDSATYIESAPQKYPNISAISDLAIDSKGNVYAISAGRLHLIDIESGEVQFLSGVTRTIDAIFFDSEDHMYGWERDETDNSNHFYKYDSLVGDLVEFHQFTYLPNDFGDIDYGRSVTMDPEEKIIYVLSGNRGLYKLDLNLPVFQRKFIRGIDTIIDEIFFTDQGRLYGKGIFSDDGIYEICKENGNVQKVVDGNFYSYVSFAHRPTFANEFGPTSVCEEEEEIVSGSADDLRMSHLLYPNPFTNVLNFTGSKIDNGPVSLYNLSGQKMGTLNEIESNGAFKVFSFASDQLAPGVYIVTATVDGKPFFAKVLKE